MTRTKIAPVCAFLIVVCATAGPAQEKKIATTPVKYDGLKQEVLKQRGKVVLVDFWATWCPSCLKAFPDIIEVQKKYADKGLVVLSVSLDDAADPEKIAKANGFLTRVASPFRNLILDETYETWVSKLDCKSLPCYFVFDRRGKWVRFRAGDNENGVNYGELEKTVVQLLNEK